MNAERNDNRSGKEAGPSPVADLMRASVDAMETFMKAEWAKDAEKAGLRVNPLMANPAMMMAAATAFGVKMTGEWASAFLSVMEQAQAAPSPEQPEAPAKAAEPPASKPAKAAASQGPDEADDLKRISGIGPKLAKLLVARGISSFAAIAALDEAGVKALDEELVLDGRVMRDDWIGQAKTILAEKG